MVAARSSAGAELAPLGAADVEGAARAVIAALPPSRGAAPERAEARLARFRDRVESALASDPGGAWVAREDGAVVGMALALRSDGVWVLSLLAVAPSAQSGGLGRGLLEHALTHAEGCRGGLIVASQDPRAMRAYARAGFELRPAVAGAGPLDRSALPAGLDALVREGSAADAERTAPIDAAVRGGARVEQVAQLLSTPDTRLYLADGGRGYAIGREGMVFGVAATDAEAARALLWRLLADTPSAGPSAGVASVHRITAGQDWAIDVLLRAGLALETDGPLFTRGRLGPPTPFLPTGAYS